MKLKSTILLLYVTFSVNLHAAEEMNVEKLANDYWKQVNSVEVGVVQNRIFTKSKKFEWSISSGFLSNNPFLETYPIGVSLGFHFNEIFSIHGYYKKAFASYSAAYSGLQSSVREQLGASKEIIPDTNRVNFFTGGELRVSFMYGKISLLGKAIQYFDAFGNIGFASVKNQTDTEIAFTIGLGQQFHILKFLSLILDYKLLWHKENVYLKGSRTNKLLRRINNYSHTANLGLCFVFNIF
jgi:outer membrane beta-barrel protein